MALETSITSIASLNASWPLSNDPGSQGDDHIRIIKDAIKKTFPNLTGAVTATQAQINWLATTGRMANQAANAVAITGGSITGITDLAVADGGTGASSASAARTNLGVPAVTTSILAGSGLTGGGSLAADRTLSLAGQALALFQLATNGFVARTGSGVLEARTILGGDGINVGNGNGVAGNPLIGVDSTVVRTSRAITAANGLTGGGDLGSDFSISIGTPSSITDTSTNSVTSTSHTHALGESSVRRLIAQGEVGAVGTYAMLRRATVNTPIVAGVNYDGPTQLRYAGVNTRDAVSNTEVEGPNNTAPAGLWQAMGSIDAVPTVYAISLFLRIS